MEELQSLIFEQKLSRRQLLDHKPICPAAYKICVYRNHSFELVEHTISLYLDYAGLGAQFVYSDYDDSLSFLELPEADMLILWLDLTRYHSDDIAGFIRERLKFLNSVFKKPVLFVPFGGAVPDISGCVCFEADSLKSQLGEKYTDLRMEPFTGTKLSQTALSQLAMELGLRYIPAFLRPALKAVVVDMDNTLYKGVLGEDGIDGVELTDGHRKLQQHLKELAGKGFFLCAASKNEESDVLELLKKRSDFPLKQEDFTRMCISWQDKSESISSIAAFLNISTDAVLFIDDNPGELNSVKLKLPKVHCLRAYDDAELTDRVLSYYPGMMKLGKTAEDALRSVDAGANAQREAMREQMSPEDYLKSLNIVLTFAKGNSETAHRICELANKTNQFIFNYKRYSQTETDDMLSSDECCVVTASLSDKLSDSGIIGVCFVRKAEGFVQVEECFVSCRALGRGIDEAIVLGMISEACRHLGENRVKVLFREGERNAPAKAFFESRLAAFADTPAEFHYEFPENTITVIKEG